MKNTLLDKNINLLVALGLVAAVGITLMLITITSAENIWSLQWLSLVGIALGCLTLSRLRPQRLGLSPPSVMLSLGFGGMLIGLFIDTRVTPIYIIATICTSSHSLSGIESIKLHMLLMPYMYVGMLLGGMAAIPSLRYLRPQCRKLCSMLTQNLLCSGWMLLGMTLGSVIFTQALQSSDVVSLNFSLMLAGMFTGMVWGMVLSVFLYRQYFNWRDRLQAIQVGSQDRL
ncbi:MULTISPECIES: hypothetical protein [Polynucleobacter]|uniref:hypothetical protein n=1 Tax=Polynucleobacter TaxID=44013 RepID=UPI000928A1AF|nr:MULTISPECIES: hypothetical protein [Polynucleobacter]MDH6155849.1 hypothetical protein [Polynucleobacter sphagniphilus]MDH6249847.1 hypothetical protein [Polynucleobacter sphagniphilus]OJI04529.1 hypothetical protein AOC28_08260 [Polynucleobacter sp. MWH-Adler-W8]